MSTIPSGLTARQMRLRMQDKGTITKTGSLYMGGTDAVSYQDIGQTIPAVEVVELEASAQYYALCSQGNGSVLHYDQLDAVAIQPASITKDKLQYGCIVQYSANAKNSFNISYVSGNGVPDSIIFSTNNTSYTLGGNGLNTLSGIVHPDDPEDGASEKQVVQLRDQNANVLATWCKRYTLTEDRSHDIGNLMTVSYNRIGNIYYVDINTGSVQVNEPVYYGDQITVTFSNVQYYTVSCYYNNQSVMSGQTVTINAGGSFRCVALPRGYTLKLLPLGGDVSSVSIVRLSSNHPAANLGELVYNPDTGETVVFEDDVLQITGTCSNIDKQVVCSSQNAETSPSDTKVMPMNTPVVVNHTNFAIGPTTAYSANIYMNFSAEYKYYSLSLTIGDGVQNIKYRTASSYSWHTISSSQNVSIRSGDYVDLMFNPASGYIATEGYYKTSESYSTSHSDYYRIPHVRDNQTWKPEVYHDGSGSMSISASAVTSGSRRTYTLGVTNTTASTKFNLMNTNVNVSVYGTSINGGLSRTFTNTVRGLTPINDDYSYLHFYAGTNPYAAGSVHYGVVGPYNIS